MPTHWTRRSRLGCATQKKTWHTCVVLWYAMISFVSSWSQFYGWALDTGLSFTPVFTFILRCLISFSLLSGFILPSPGIDFNKWCTAWWIKQSHQIMFSQISSWAPWHAASLCEQEQTLWVEVSGLCWRMWRSAIKTSVGPSFCSLCNNKLLWFYMPVKALFHTFLLVRRPWP